MFRTIDDIIVKKLFEMYDDKVYCDCFNYMTVILVDNKRIGYIIYYSDSTIMEMRIDIGPLIIYDISNPEFSVNGILDTIKSHLSTIGIEHDEEYLYRDIIDR